MANNQILLQPSDFTGGLYNVAASVEKTALLQAAINRYEVKYIMQLLSNSTLPPYTTGLGQLFINECKANWPNGPTSSRFTFINQEFDQQDGYVVRHSDGIKDIIARMVYYHYIMDNIVEDTQAGVASSNSNAANKAVYRNAMRFAERTFNGALESVKSTIWWLKQGNNNGGGSTVYPEYVPGRHIRAKLSSML